TIAESDLNGSSGEHTYFSFRLRNERKETTIRFKEVKLEKGTKATDWTPAPEDMATQAQLSVLNDNINMRVSKGELMSQINIEAGRTLIQSNKLYLDAQSVVFSGKAFIPGAVIKNASIDGAKIANATIGSAKIANLDVNKISGNRTEFVQSAWNNAVGGNVSISGSGIVTTASTGAQGLIQNGVFLARNPSGSTVGYIGFDQVGTSPAMTVTTTLGSHFRVRQHLGSNKYIETLRIGSGGGPTHFSPQSIFV